MRDKYLIILGLLAITIIILGLAVAVPAIRQLAADKTMIDAETKKMEALLTQGQNITENRKNLSRVQGEMAQLVATDLKIGQELNFITDLERIADQNNIEQDITFNNTDVINELAGKKVIPVTLKLNGGLKALMNYLSELEGLNYYVSITKISLNSQGVKAKGQVGAATYQEEGKEAVDQPEAEITATLYGLTYWQ